MNNIEENDYPIQYKIGNVNFYGYEIKVDERSRDVCSSQRRIRNGTTTL